MSNNPYDVKTQSSPVTPSSQESDLFGGHFVFLDTLEWREGMKFIIPPSSDPFYSGKIPIYPYKSPNGRFDFIDQRTFQFTVLEYQGLELRKEGKEQAILVFKAQEKMFEHAVMATPGALKFPGGYTVPDLIYLEEVDWCREVLIGKRVYIITRSWRKDKPNGGSTVVSKSPKFVPCTITNVGLGTQQEPVKVLFKTDDSPEEYFITLQFSGINSSTRQNVLKFNQAFSFTDPRLNYPSISDDVWMKIQKQEVAPGMNKEECELSWAKPRKVNNVVFNENEFEMWDFGSELLLFRNTVLDLVKTGTDRFGIRIKG